MAGELPDEATALFREAPESFIAARDALVRTLRDAGRDDDAAAVKKLRKPTVVVWALDQLAVRDGDGVRSLIDAGSELRVAQQAAASGSSGAAERMRDASAARRAVIARLTEVATTALEEAGRGASGPADTISAALAVASIDPEAGPRLAAGTLAAVPANPGGFGDVFGLSLVPSDAPDAGEAAPAPAPADDVAELKADVARLRRDRDAATRKASKAGETADRLARERDEARERADKASDKHAAADAQAGEAELEAKRAERDLARAVAKLEEGGR